MHPSHNSFYSPSASSRPAIWHPLRTSPGTEPPASAALPQEIKPSYSARERLFQKFQNRIVNEKGIIIHSISRESFPPLNHQSEQLLSSFQNDYRLGQVLRDIMVILSSFGMTLDQWDIGGDALFALLGKGGYFEETFFSIGIPIKNLCSENIWESRLNEPVWHVDLYINDLKMTDLQQLSRSLNERLEIPFEKSPFGLKGRLSKEGQSPLLLRIHINNRLKKCATCDPLVISHFKTPESDSSVTRKLRFNYPNPWQILMDLTLGTISSKHPTHFLNLVDRYTKGETLLDDHFENGHVQRFRMEVMEKDKGKEVCSKFLDYLENLLLDTPEESYLLALQTLISSGLKDDDCASFLNSLNDPLKLDRLKNPIFKEIQRLVIRENIPFSLIGALLQVAGFCQHHAWEITPNNEPAFTALPAKMKDAFGFRVAFPECSRTLLLSGATGESLKVISKSLIHFIAETLSPFFSQLFLSTPLIPAKKARASSLLDFPPRLLVEMEKSVHLLQDSENGLQNVLGLICSMIISRYTSKGLQEKELLSGTLRMLALNLPKSFKSKLLLNVKISFTETPPPLFEYLYRLSLNKGANKCDLSLQTANLLLEYQEPSIKSMGLLLIIQGIEAGNKALFPIGTSVISELVAANKFSSALHLFKLLQQKAGLPLDKFPEAVHVLIQGGVNKEDFAFSVGNLILPLLQSKHPKNEQLSKDLTLLIERLLSKQTALACDLFMSGVSSGALNPQSTSFKTLPLRVCEAMKNSHEQGILFTGYTVRFCLRNKLLEPTHEANIFLLELSEHLLKAPGLETARLLSLILGTIEQAHLEEAFKERLQQARFSYAANILGEEHFFELPLKELWLDIQSIMETQPITRQFLQFLDTLCKHPTKENITLLEEILSSKKVIEILHGHPKIHHQSALMCLQQTISSQDILAGLLTTPLFEFQDPAFYQRIAPALLKALQNPQPPSNLLSALKIHHACLIKEWTLQGLVLETKQLIQSLNVAFEKLDWDRSLWILADSQDALPLEIIELLETFTPHSAKQKHILGSNYLRLANKSFELKDKKFPKRYLEALLRYLPETKAAPDTLVSLASHLIKFPMEIQKTKSLLKAAKSLTEQFSDAHKFTVEKVLESDFGRNKILECCHWLLHNAPLLEQSAFFAWTDKLLPELLALKQQETFDTLKIALSLLRKSAMAWNTHWQKTLFRVRTTQNTSLYKEACSAWEEQSEIKGQTTKSHNECWAEIIPMQGEENFLKSLPSILLQKENLLHQTALERCLKLSNQKIKAHIESIHALHLNLQNVDLALIKPFLTSGLEKSLPSVFKIMERAIELKTDLQRVAHLLPLVIEAAQKFPAYQQEIHQLARSALNPLLPFLNLSDCVQKLLLSPSVLSFDVCTEYFLKKLQQHTLDRKQAGDLARGLIQLIERALSADAFEKIENLLQFPKFLKLLEEGDKKELLGLFLTRRLACQENFTSIETLARALESFLVNHTLLATTDPAFETCFLTAVRFNIVLFQKQKDIKLFANRFNRITDTLPMEEHVHTKKTPRQKKCILLYLKMTRLHMEAISNGSFTELDQLKTLYCTSHPVFKFSEIERFPEMRQELFGTFLEFFQLTFNDEKHLLGHFNMALLFFEKLITSSEFFDADTALKGYLAIAQTLPLVKDAELIQKACEIAAKTTRRFSATGDFLFNLMKIMTSMDSHNALSFSLSMMVAKGSALNHEQWASCCCMHLSAILVSVHKDELLKVLMEATRADSKYLPKAIGLKNLLDWNTHLITELLLPDQSTVNHNKLSRIENTLAFLGASCRKGVFNEKPEILLNLLDQHFPSLIQLEQTHADRYPILTPAFFIQDFLPEKISDPHIQKQRALLAYKCLDFYLMTRTTRPLFIRAPIKALIHSDIFYNHRDLAEALIKRLSS